MYGKMNYGLDSFSCGQIHEGTHDKSGEEVQYIATWQALNRLVKMGNVKRIVASSPTGSPSISYSIMARGRKFYKDDLREAKTITDTTGVFVNYYIRAEVPSTLMSIHRYVKKHAHPNGKNWNLSKEKLREIYSKHRRQYFVEKPYQLIGYADCGGNLTPYIDLIEKHGIEIGSSN